MKNGFPVGFVIMLISALSFGTGDILVKVIGENLSPWQITSGRGIVGLCIVISLARFQWRTFVTSDWPWQVGIGLSSTLAYVCILFAVKMLPLSLAMPVIYIYPALGALLSPLINNEKPSKIDWVAITMAFIGICVLTQGAIGAKEVNWAGMAWGLGGAFWMGLMANLSRRQVKDRSFYVVIFYLLLINLMVCLPVSILVDQPTIPTGSDFTALAFIISPIYGCGAVLMIVAFKHLTAHRGSVILTMEAVVASFFGLMFLNEPLTLSIGLGGVLVISSAIIIALSKKQTVGEAPNSNTVAPRPGP